MEYVKEIDILGVRESGILELEVRGCLSRQTAAEFNAAVSCFDFNLQGVILDTRESLIAILPDQIELFSHVYDCPVVYLSTPEQAVICNAIVGVRRVTGYRRNALTRKDSARRWLDTAIRQAR